MSLIHAQATPATLVWAERLVVLLWIGKTGWTAWSDLAELPFVLYEPVSFHRWIPAEWLGVLLRADVLAAMRASAIVLLLLALWSPLRALGFLGAGCVLMHHQALLYGFGFVNHQEIVLLYALFVFGLFALAGARWRERAPGAPLVVILALLAFSYVLSGVYRVLLHPEVLVDTGAMMGWILLNSYRPLYYGWEIGPTLPWGPTLAVLAQTGLVIVTVLEILAPVALWSRGFRWLFVAVMMVPFHLSCLLLMNIFFWENGALMLLFWETARRAPPGSAADPRAG